MHYRFIFLLQLNALEDLIIYFNVLCPYNINVFSKYVLRLFRIFVNIQTKFVYTSSKHVLEITEPILTNEMFILAWLTIRGMWN